MTAEVSLYARDVFEKPEIDIPYTKFVLDTGLTLMVHEDHKAPIVAVNIWYHVGSKNEGAGKTGFAHLFEHLMFNGSEHFNNDYFQALERVGATDLNGTTNRDRTNYFQNVPTSALDLVLWMESDRMGHLLGAIDQAKLDEQRGVVQNEKRQGENQPYGRVWELIAANTFPRSHPYSWTTIGSMEDLDAASLEDVREWFRTFYGAANAVLVVAGDVDPRTAREKVQKYFGEIPSGPPVPHQEMWVAKRTETHRQKMQDRVPQARIYKIWNVPKWGSVDAEHLDLTSDLLSSGKTSRLYKRLVYEEQAATDVAAYLYPGEIASQFIIQATARPDQELADVEVLVDEELGRFLAEGPTEEELRRVKVQFFSSFIRGIERIGGFGGKSDILAMHEVYAGDPEYYKVRLDRIAEARAQDIRQAANEWLSAGVYILEVQPFPTYKVTSTDVDRTQLPAVEAPPEPEFPRLERTRLQNGLEIVLAQRHAVPLITFQLHVNAGYAADQFFLPGTAELAMGVLDEGTRTRTALEISEALDQLGARLMAGSNLDVSTVSLSTLKQNLQESLAIFAQVILEPTFPNEEFVRLQREQLAAIQREKTSPYEMALRVVPRLIYGPEHAYGNPLTGSGTEKSVQKVSRDDLVRFHRTWFKPNNSTLVIVGDTTLENVLPVVRSMFDPWERGEVPEKNIQNIPLPDASEMYIIDRPDAIQSIIFAGQLAPPKANPNEIAIETMNRILGGTFTSRINMNLREDKHWSYGAHSILVGARGQRPFIVYAPVQTDKTRESVTEILKEIQGVLENQPVSPEELEKAMKNQVLRLAGAWETSGAIAGSIAEIVRYKLPDDYFQTYPEKVKALTLPAVNAAARQVLHPSKLVWVVVGDRNQIEPELRKLGFSQTRFVDADGELIQ